VQNLPDFQNSRTDSTSTAKGSCLKIHCHLFYATMGLIYGIEMIDFYLWLWDVDQLKLEKPGMVRHPSWKGFSIRAGHGNEDIRR
jgi:hypothetical protein